MNQLNQYFAFTYITNFAYAPVCGHFRIRFERITLEAKGDDSFEIPCVLTS